MRLSTPFRRAAAVTAFVAALAVSASLAAAPASAYSTANNVRLNAVEYRLASLINNARTSRGMRALVVAPGTTDLARRWSMNQAQRNVLSHNPSLVYGVEHAGSASWHQVAENVGRGWDADSLFTAYMNSPGHRANILDADMRYLGIGWVQRPDGSGYNTQVFVDSYSGTYGHTREPAVGGLADTVTPTSTASLGSFENGWDPRVQVTRSGTGMATGGPYFETPTTGDQSVRFSVRETVVSTGGAAEMRVRDAFDLKNAKSLTVRLGANTGSGRAVTVDVIARRELGTNVLLGHVTIPSGRFVTVTLPLPSGAKNFRNAIVVSVPRTALHALSSTLTGRSVLVRLADLRVDV